MSLARVARLAGRGSALSRSAASSSLLSQLCRAACTSGVSELDASSIANLAADCSSSRSFASSSIQDETHDDFRPQIKSGPAPSAAEQIKQDIADNKVFIYMKGDPSAPQCGFSNMACRILDAYGVDYESRNVLADPDVREAVKEFTEWPTIPQVFVNGEFVGGSDILLSMHQSGDLFTMLESGGAKPVQPRTG